MTYMWAFACRFKRASTGAKSTGWETGIAIGPSPDDVQVIIDKDWKEVPAPLYDISHEHYNGCFSIGVK